MHSMPFMDLRHFCNVVITIWTNIWTVLPCLPLFGCHKYSQPKRQAQRAAKTRKRKAVSFKAFRARKEAETERQSTLTITTDLFFKNSVVIIFIPCCMDMLALESISELILRNLKAVELKPLQCKF